MVWGAFKQALRACVLQKLQAGIAALWSQTRHIHHTCFVAHVAWVQIPKDLHKYTHKIVEADGFAQVPEHKVRARGCAMLGDKCNQPVVRLARGQVQPAACAAGWCVGGPQQA